jgi:hypothetical protein
VSGETPVKVGGYYSHRMHGADSGTPVRISMEFLREGHPPRYGAEYVGNAGQGGGSSFSWPAEEFFPITDPADVARVRIFESRRLIVEHESAAAAARRELAGWTRALDAILVACGAPAVRA